jgi:hypothetical protein
MWNADDQHDRWIYRTIYPADLRTSEHRLIQFRNMEEFDAEANWNFDENETTNQPLTMSQRKTLAKANLTGLSFFSFANEHLNAVISPDLPTQAEIGDVFAIIVESNPSIANSNAYKQIVTKRSQPKKIRNAANAEVTFKAFICYKANSEFLTAGDPFCCIYDNNPQNHRTVAPVENAVIECIECTIGGRLGAEPITQPTLYAMLGFRMHCFRLRTAAKPRPLSSRFNRDVHRLACVLYRGFDTDCSEEDSKNIVDVLRFLDQLDYRFSALKLLKKQCVIELLSTLFLNECINEEETMEVEAVLLWMRNDFDQQRVSELELVGNYRTKLQVAVRYDVQCSNDAIDSINQSYENHFISDASSVVPRYQVLMSTTTSYRSIVDFACDYVPVHLIDFPVAELDGRKLIPTDPMVVMEAIVNHDELEPQSGENQGGVFLASPDEREVYVRGAGFLSNKQYWGSKWLCTAIARTTNKRCCNKTHHSSGRCHLHRDFTRYPKPTPNILPVDNFSVSK